MIHIDNTIHTAQSVIVTGGGRGIGKAISLRLAQDGWSVIVSDIDDSASSVATEIRNRGGIAKAKIADVSSYREVESLVAFSVDSFGALSAAVNNAGVGTEAKLLGQISESEWTRALNITLSGTFYSLSAELNQMMKQNYGRVVNIASIAALTANPMRTPYGATKHGVLSLTQSAAIEYAPYGIRVNAVAPGPINTDAFNKLSDSEKEKQIQKIPMNRVGSPEDIASATSWLLDDESNFVTGAILPVDGGAQFS